ncbi:MAG: M28 family peptidase [Ilumatobacter fluminis]|uniref:Peptidase M28-like protein n=1 Tax=Ilumatobacter fluminis TaxID=467091 RepID=A0A4R7HXQ4_9ACTN|nr:M28 family peptidase [Ilumatobacter fluminis]TDT14996.1 peptidase M28-like protein [Ilumatobacter fluminis]
MSLFDRLAAAVPDADQQLAWIDAVCALGVRRPGTDENARTVEWLAAEFGRMGYDVELQPVRTLTSHPGPAMVTAWLTAEPSRRLEVHGLTMPFSTATDRARFRLRNRASDDRLDPDDAALEHVRLTALPTSLLENGILARHDPAGEFASHVHVLPFGSALGKEIDVVVASGAGAMVGVVDAPWSTSDYFVPYDGVVRPLPAVWIDRDSGAALDELVEEGDVTVEISSTVDHRETVDHNVIATAPSPTNDEWVVIGSHHDAPWASAVEDGSGIAQVLAQAAAWSEIPADERPISLAFLLTAAHMSEGAGTRAFIASWPHLDRVRFALHLEHIAVEAEPDGDGGIRPTDRPEVRWWFVSAPDPDEAAALTASTARAIDEHRLDRSMVLPPDVFGPMPPTDGGFFHPAGVPMVNLLAAPMYLFDPADTIDMVHRPSLVPTALAALQLTLDAVAGWPTDD